ncbi:hypothetical protein TNCV_1417901 [Trichonephila clavipes]|nr:hypothetical protein TNCV_1417901 [Trichonephila clavipes]
MLILKVLTTSCGVEVWKVGKTSLGLVLDTCPWFEITRPIISSIRVVANNNAFAWRVVSGIKIRTLDSIATTSTVSTRP